MNSYDIKSRVDESCVCRTTCRLEHFLQPCILLLLRDNPSYGYELINRLTAFGFEQDTTDPATVYKNLRMMEKGGWVKSQWDTAGPGPAKRNYKVTPEGEEYLDAWAVMIRKCKESLERFLEIHRSQTKGAKRTVKKK